MLDIILDLAQDLLNATRALSDKDKQLAHYHVTYALNQTKIHMLHTSRGEKDQASASLSNIWQRAGQKIQQIKNTDVRNLAFTIEQKSKYWADPDRFDQQQFDQYRMRIFQVESTLNELCQ